ALSDRWAKPIAAPALIEEFIRADDSSSGRLRWTIANALEVVADDSVFDDIVRLLRDKKCGKARQMLALALGNMKRRDAVLVLTELLQDDEVAGHAIIALGKLKAKEARSAVEPFLHRGKAWVCKEARRAIKKMDG